jgi:hypothetical protein
MSVLRVFVPAAVAGTLVVCVSACAGGSASAADVCTAFDGLGGSVRLVNGVYDNPVFTHADDLGDVAARYRGGADLDADAEALHGIADDEQTSVDRLEAATGHIAQLCGHDLTGVATSRGVAGQGQADGSVPTLPATPDPETITITEPPAVVDDAYQRLTGPGGISVEVPGTWRDGAGSDSYRQVGEADPAGAFARFGGYAPSGASLLAEITGGERGNPKIRGGYQRISLSATSFQGAEAVDWQFTFVKDGVTRQVHGLYWRTDGTEYLIYLSAPSMQWPALEPVFDVVRDSVTTP